MITFLAIICLINLDLLLFTIMKEREKCLSHHIVFFFPAPSPVIEVSLDNSKEALIIYCSPHILAALNDVNISLVLKLPSDLCFIVSVSNFSVFFCCAYSFQWYN